MASRYAGIDWASEQHDVVVSDEDGDEVLAATFAHDEKGLAALCRVLVRLEVVLVAIERPDGLLVERLLDAGLRVLALHPNKVAAARDRFRRMCSLSSGSTERRIDRVGWPRRCGAEVVRSGSRIGSSCPRASAGASILVCPIQTTSSETLVSGSRTCDMPRTNFLALYRDGTVGLDARCAREFGARSERSGSARPALTSLPRTARSCVADSAHPASSRPSVVHPRVRVQIAEGGVRESVDRRSCGFAARYRGADGARLP